MFKTREDRGFTLIELMIVVLIVAILIAIAIPTFLGQRKSAEDSAAQSNLKLALTTEKAYAAGGANAFTDDLAELRAIEPSLFNVTGAVVPTNSFDPVKVTVSGTDQAVCIVAQTNSGEFLAVWESRDAGTRFGRHTNNPFATCDDTGPPTAGTWSTSSW